MRLKSAGMAAVAICVLALCVLGVPGANAGPRDSAQRVQPRQPPPASTPQTEPTDLDGGKTPQQVFAATCAVCHQSMQGLAKGRGAGQLGSFLRQHYTTGVGQANALAGYLASVPERGPARGTPAEPATASRRQPKPEEARRPDHATRPDKPEPAVAATQPTRRMRNEDGSTQPVDGLVVLPPGAADVPSASEAAHPREAKPHETRPAAARPEARPGEPPLAARARPAATPAKPAETPAAKPVEQDKPAELARPAEKPADIPGAAGGEPATAQTKAPASSAAVSPLTEEKPAPVKVQEIPL
jgi:hypothetical protein